LRPAPIFDCALRLGAGQFVQCLVGPSFELKSIAGLVNGTQTKPWGRYVRSIVGVMAGHPEPSERMHNRSLEYTNFPACSIIGCERSFTSFRMTTGGMLIVLSI
jgi:hypothetical protein